MDDKITQLLEGYPVVEANKVDWGDMDAFQHVNNVVYFRYVENVRVVYGIRIGITDRMKSEGIGPILAWTDCKYIRPVKFPDTLHIGVRLTELKGSDMMLEYKLVSEAQGAVVAMAKSHGVYYDYRKLERVDFPEDLVKRMEEVEGRSVDEINGGE